MRNQYHPFKEEKSQPLCTKPYGDRCDRYIFVYKNTIKTVYFILFQYNKISYLLLNTKIRTMKMEFFNVFRDKRNKRTDILYIILAHPIVT